MTENDEWQKLDEFERLANRHALRDYMRTGEVQLETREMFRTAFWVKTKLLLRAYNPEQQRKPAGTEGGGQWAPADGGGEGVSQSDNPDSITVAANDGTPGPNQAQNKQTNDASSRYKLDSKQRDELHDEVSKQNKGFKGVDEDAKFIKERDKGKTSKDDIQQRRFTGKNKWGF
jgi:hypothetical protein